ncbi:SigE family RNA polymerase sigma factor [Nocardioides glacieisoli]|jgi:RNA polymerase sigma-70 factor (sigma-E family)|uniref:SigE family RNA polymerase sigma factor n=1 Tax=Nocardioides glacieisoli TaxID=1168730 RepID=A0A4V1RLP2_9ACTN|nr:SigE family RNA polymerase sigma factor [Nocardioides glacieisoli]MDI4643267.1 SigE family RNA polymerase sigma factor [Rhodoblastus acidophilus]RYB96472.1 SigE family RNA polymerase sigma factor [Nocardioides glacieisoli]
MRRAEREAAYSAFVLSRQDHLRRIAYALCGNWHDADDLLQVALTRLYTAWPRISSDGNPEAYVRTILMRANVDNHRLRGRRVRTARLDAAGDPAALAGLPVDERDALIEAVQRLPEMQRKVIVLRHWLGFDVHETARELNISDGTVKSHSSRGLAALRARLDAESDEEEQPTGAVGHQAQRA